MVHILHQYGFSFIFLAVFAESLGLPVPSYPVILVAAALAAPLHLRLPMIFLVCAAAGAGGRRSLVQTRPVAWAAHSAPALFPLPFAGFLRPSHGAPLPAIRDKIAVRGQIRAGIERRCRASGGDVEGRAPALYRRGPCRDHILGGLGDGLGPGISHSSRVGHGVAGGFRTEPAC